MADAGAHLASRTGGMKKIVAVVRFGLAKRELVVEDLRMLSPLDPAALPKSVTALRTLLLSREQEHAAELQAAREGLKEQVLQNEQLRARLAKLLRQRFGSSSEKMRGAIDQFELIIGDLEEEIAETSPPEPEPEVDPSAIDPEIQPRRRKPKRKPLPENLPRDVVEHAPACACPKCGGALRRLGEDVTEVLEYLPGSFRVTRHVRPKMSCRCCESITQPPAPSLPINRGLAGPGLLAHVLVGKFCDHLPLHRQAEIYARDGIFDLITLADWVGQCARLLRPLVDAVGAHVMAAERIHADDTTVPVLSAGKWQDKNRTDLVLCPRRSTVRRHWLRRRCCIATVRIAKRNIRKPISPASKASSRRTVTLKFSQALVQSVAPGPILNRAQNAPSRRSTSANCASR